MSGMERSREARRVSMAAMNGGSVSKRRHRSSSLRDSPVEDGGTETPEALRVRERAVNRDRERDRSSGAKRGRVDGEERTEERLEAEEGDHDRDPGMSHRSPSASSPAPQNVLLRGSFPLGSSSSSPAKHPRPPLWRFSNEVMGVSIPRRPRTASAKRSNEYSVPGAAPAMPSTVSTSPSPSPPSAWKKSSMGRGYIQRPIKISKPPAVPEDIEFEVAEVLFGMTQQFPVSIESKDEDGSVKEASIHLSPPTREESSTNPCTITCPMLEAEDQHHARLGNSEKSSTISMINVESAEIENVRFKLDLIPQPHAMIIDAQQDGAMRSSISEEMRESKTKTESSDAIDEINIALKEKNSSNFADDNLAWRVNAQANSDLADDPPSNEKFSIDLMAFPHAKSSEKEYCDKADGLEQEEIELVSKIADPRRKDERNSTEPVETSLGDGKERNSKDPILMKMDHKENPVGSQSDLEQHLNEQEVLGTPHNLGEALKYLSEPVKAEAKEKTVPSGVSLPLQMPPGWPGNIPPFVYMGQISPQQSVLSTDRNPVASKQLQVANLFPPQHRKRCSTHCYIAQTINYQQQLAKINHFWPAVTGTMQLWGKHYSFNSLPPSEAAAHGGSLQGSLPGRSILPSRQKQGCSVENFSREKNPVANSHPEASQRNQIMMFHQQAAQPGSANNLHLSPAHIFSDQQPLSGGGAAASRGPGAPKFTDAQKHAYEIDNAGRSNTTANILTCNAGVGTKPSMSYNHASLSQNDAQYLAILQNNAMPFYGGSFYTSQEIHLHQHIAPLSQSQSGHQNSTTSSGSSSSQKLPQHSQIVLCSGPSAAATTVGSHSFHASKQGPHLSESSANGNPVPFAQAQKGIYGHSFTMPLHQPNFALISPAVPASASGSGVDHNEKQPQHQGVKVELRPNQAYAMSFASPPGVASSATAVVPASLDFSSVTPNHVLFQSLPDAMRHGYQMAPAAKSGQHHKKSRNQDDGKSQAESLNGNVTSEKERKMIASARGAVGGLTLTSSKLDNEVPGPSNLSNCVMDISSRTLNSIPPVHAGGRLRSQPSISTPASSLDVDSLNFQQQQKQQLQLLQLQNLQRQQSSLAARPKSLVSSNTASGYTERFVNSAVNKFSQTLSNFPQALIQGSRSTSQSPQWKGACGSTAVLIPAPPTASCPSTKGHHYQQPTRVSQHSSSPAHQTQISFGASSLKMSTGSSAGLTSLPSMPSSSFMAESFPNSQSKSASGKQTSHVPASPPLSQHQSNKISQSSSSLKPSSLNRRNIPSVHGHPSITPAPSSSSSSSSKQQQQHSRSQQKTSHLPSHLFFSSAYVPGQPAQSNASSASTVAAASSATCYHFSEVISQQFQ